MATCPRCESPQLERRADSALAECRACHLVFDPSRPRPMARRPRQRSDEAPTEEQVPLEAPPGMEAIETRRRGRVDYRSAGPGLPEAVEIRYPWRHSYGGATASAALLFGGGLLWAGLSFVRDDAFHVACGAIVGLIGALLLGLMFVNTMVIRVAEGALTLRHGPVPWFGSRRFEASQIEQLYTEHYEVVPFDSDRRPRSFYRVMVRVRGEHMPRILLEDMSAPGPGLYLEKTLERVLGIEDAPVFGEIGYRMQMKGP